MKNQFLFLLMSCFFLLSNMPYAHADESGLDGGTIAVIFNGKMGTVSHSFSLPEKYLNKDGSLAAPLQITLTQNGKRAAFDVQTYDLNIELPHNLSGTYEVVVWVGDYSVTRSLSF